MSQQQAPESTGLGEIRCIKCGCDASLRLRLDDLDTIECPECNDDFSAEELRQALKGLRRLLAVVDAMKAAADFTNE